MLTDQIEFVDTNQSIATSSPTPILGDVDTYENEIHSAFTDHLDRAKRALVDGESPDSKRLRLTVLPVDFGTRKISSASYTKAVQVLWKWLAPRCFSANRGEALTEAIEPMEVVNTPESGPLAVGDLIPPLTPDSIEEIVEPMDMVPESEHNLNGDDATQVEVVDNMFVDSTEGVSDGSSTAESMTDHWSPRVTTNAHNMEL